jgi:hypothetical protein
MRVLRNLLCLLFAGAPVLMPQAVAQGALPRVSSAPAAAPAAAPRGTWLPGGRSYLGLNLRPASSAPCAGMALTCRVRDPSAELYTGAMLGNFWAVELGYRDLGHSALTGAEWRTRGLSLSLVGKARVAPAVGVFGKVGTSYGRAEGAALATALMGSGPGRGSGLSFGGGVSFDFTPRLSATLEWDSNDFRFAGTGREPVHSTSMGLKYRY